MFEDHAFEQGLDDFLFFGCKLRDRFKLEAEITIGAALIGAEDQHICTHLQSDREPSNHIQRGLRGAALIAPHLNRNGHLLHNPAARLAFPRKEQPLPHVLNESEIARLIETPDTATVIGIRDRALMETLYATGIRHAEAHRLDLYDMDTVAHRLMVRLGKGQRDRLVPLTETATYWLTRYVTVARAELAAGNLWAKGDDVASLKSFHQLQLCGSP